jgi:serine/threonine protein kinase
MTLFGGITEDDIDHEVEIIKQLCTTGHVHIVNILQHDWLNSKYHFIDMELCSINLEDYISGRSNHSELPDLKHEPVFVSRDCSKAIRMSNIFTIFNHIVQGVAFIHEQQYSHRDLKPQNSLHLKPSLLILVLYSRYQRTWKIADFGLTAAATSKLAVTTLYQRGTPGYRAPEILSDDPKFTNKVDIWAMGCILFRLCTGDHLFKNDFDVKEFEEFDLVKFGLDSFLSKICGSSYRRMLAGNASERPQISTVRVLTESSL